MICNKNVKNVNKEKHLGHVLSSDYCSSNNLIDIDNAIMDMKIRTNVIKTQFKSVSGKARATLFNSQCLALYGFQLWRLDDRNIKKLCIT